MASLPKKAARTAADAPLTPLWPELYDGWAGVARNGAQAGSAAVSSLPSVSAARMAVTGRQKLYVYLLSQMANVLSAPATLSRANSRAFSTSVSPRAWATSWASWFQQPPAVSVPAAPYQNRAIWDCSAVRVVLLAAPMLLISSKAAVYSGLFRAGGGGGRNAESLGM